MKLMVKVFVALIVITLSVAALASLQSCFDEFIANLAACNTNFQEGSASHTACVDGATMVLKACIERELHQIGHPLYNAKICSIALYRSTGKPSTVAKNIHIAESGTYYFNLYNGSPTDKSTRVSAAEIKLLPDKTLFSPNDFNKNVWFSVVPVYLDAGDYVLSGELRSEPGTFVTVIVSDRDFTAANFE